MRSPLRIALAAGILGGLLGMGAGWMRAADPGDAHRRMTDPDSRPTPAEPVTAGKPVVALPQGDTFEFGALGVGQKGSHRFLIKNTGMAELTLNVHETTCKCAIGELDDGRIQPGESTYVTLEWTGNQASQDFYQVATISTNDPQRKFVDLAISGRIVPVLRAVPTNITFTDVADDHSREAESIIYAYDDDDLPVLDYTWSNPQTAEYFDVAFEPLDLAQLERKSLVRSGIVCRVRLKAGLALGVFHQRLRLTLNSKREPELEIPVQGSIVSQITVSGPQYDKSANLLKIGSVKQDEGAEQILNLFVKGDGHEQVALTVSEVDPQESMKIHQETPRHLGPLSIHQLRIEIPPDGPLVNRLGSPNAPWGKIEIDSNHATVSKLVIFVRFAVVPSE